MIRRWEYKKCIKSTRSGLETCLHDMHLNIFIVGEDHVVLWIRVFNAHSDCLKTNTRYPNSISKCAITYWNTSNRSHYFTRTICPSHSEYIFVFELRVFVQTICYKPNIIDLTTTRSIVLHEDVFREGDTRNGVRPFIHRIYTHNFTFMCRFIFLWLYIRPKRNFLHLNELKRT